MKTLLITALLLASNFVHANDIILSKGIKESLRIKIEKDLEVLENLKFKDNTNERTLVIMGLKDMTAQSATDWLGTRVNYVVEEKAFTTIKMLIKKAVTVEKENVEYPNQNIIPYSIDPTNAKGTISSADGMIVMSNIGAGLYLSGKEEKKLYAMRISRGFLKKSIKAVLDSPRAGIIQIGEGLFSRELSINNNNPDSIANSINRLSTFFHEARHSDGNGSSLAFAHSPCPVGHDMEGAYACDESLNGAYTVGAVMLREMLKACDDSCTEREKEILKLVILDSENRVLHVTRKGLAAEDWDASPESM